MYPRHSHPARAASAVGLALAVLFLSGLPAAAAAPVRAVTLQALSGLAEAPPQAIVYVARDIITMDPEQPQAEAIAVRDGRFIAVGSRKAVTAAAGPDARLDETFAGKVLLPGFIAPQVHPVAAALALGSTIIAIDDWTTAAGLCPAVRDPEAYQERLLHALADHHRGGSGVFLSFGYHQDFHGPMSRRLLDGLMPSAPVIIWHRAGRAFHLNSAALERTGIDAALVQGLGAEARDGIDLDAGHFRSHGALAILHRLAPLLATPAQQQRSLELTEAYYHRNGITTVCAPGGLASAPLRDAMEAVYADSATPFEHCFIPDGTALAARHPPTTLAAAAALVAATRALTAGAQGRTRRLPRQVWLATDGDPLSGQMQEGDGGEPAGAWAMEPAAFDAAFQSYWDAGWQIHVQAHGEAAVALALTSLEQAMARAPREDHRTRLTSLVFAAPDQVERWAALGGSIGANPHALSVLAGRRSTPGSPGGMDPERAAAMVPLAAVLEHDVPLSFGSDMPMAPAQPLLLVWAAVNRLTAEGRIPGPGHQLPRTAALRAVTLGAAHALRQEDSIGSIAVGKRANLTILEASPLDVPATWIKDIPVWGTMLDGRVQPVPSGPDAAAGQNARRRNATGGNGADAARQSPPARGCRDA